MFSRINSPRFSAGGELVTEYPRRMSSRYHSSITWPDSELNYYDHSTSDDQLDYSSSNEKVLGTFWFIIKPFKLPSIILDDTTSKMSIILWDGTKYHWVLGHLKALGTRHVCGCLIEARVLSFKRIVSILRSVHLSVSKIIYTSKSVH